MLTCVAEIGWFRIGAADDGHLVVGHLCDHTEAIYRSDSHVFEGTGGENKAFDSWCPWSRAPLSKDTFDPEKPSVFVPRKNNPAGSVLQFGKTWRIGAMDDAHLVIGHKNGNVARIYRWDRLIFGNGRDWNPWTRTTKVGE